MDAYLQKKMSDQDKFHRFRYHLVRGFMEPGDTVMDIGSGSGYGAEILSHIAKEVIAFEIDKSEIAEAVRKYGQDNIIFIASDIAETEIPRVDVVCALDVLEHLYHPEEIIEKIKSKTRKYFIVSIPVGMKLVWSVEDREFQEEGDNYHKSVFKSGQDFDNLVIDNVWQKYFSLTEGKYYIAVYYNMEGILKT